MNAISNHFQQFTAKALSIAAEAGDMAEIDRITDELAAAGLCRPRTDTSLLDQRRKQCERNAELCGVAQ